LFINKLVFKKLGSYEETEDQYSSTYQHKIGIEYAIRFCKRAKYIIKVKDDQFVNTLEILETTIPTMIQNEGSFYCTILMEYVPFPVPGVADNDEKVEYCSDEAYLADYKAIKNIYAMIPYVPFYKDENDDLIFTGRLRLAFLQRKFIFSSSLNNVSDSDKTSLPHYTDNLQIISHQYLQRQKDEPCFYVAKWYAKYQRKVFHKLRKNASIVKDAWCLWYNALENKNVFIGNQKRKFIWAAMAQ
jgi:hypothetical protein